jgi:hypothetical protein
MERDFHYYLTYAIAKLTKIERPEIVAYASQFVDDNNEGQFSIDGEEVGFPERLKVGGGYYYPVMTQSLSPKSLDIYVQRYVYVPFHFLPGDSSIEIKGQNNPLSVTPYSPNAQAVLATALSSEDPYRIGIALHTVADTWSHQNFTGLQEDWNAVYPWYNVFKSLIPNIGHAEAGHSPDVISEPWIDYRIGQDPIDNKQRAFEAAETIYQAVQAKAKQGSPWDTVKDAFRGIIDAPDYDERIRRVSSLVGEGIPNYSKDIWIDAALEKDKSEKTCKLVPSYQQTPWYHFHQAAKAQLAEVVDLIKEI